MLDVPALVDAALVTGDIAGLERVNQNNLSGKNGAVLKVAAESGEWWAEHGFVGGMKEFGSALKDDLGGQAHEVVNFASSVRDKVKSWCGWCP